jgi:hypothetical protein
LLSEEQEEWYASGASWEADPAPALLAIQKTPEVLSLLALLVQKYKY